MSKTDLFIKDLLITEENKDIPYLIEITKEQYDLLFTNTQHISISYIKDLDVYHNINNQPFPLFKVHVIKDYQNSYESGSIDWEFEFIFKHKGKYYRFIDYGST